MNKRKNNNINNNINNINNNNMNRYSNLEIIDEPKMSQQSTTERTYDQFLLIKIIKWLKAIAFMLFIGVIVLILILICFVFQATIVKRVDDTVTSAVTIFDINALASNLTIVAGNMKAMSTNPAQYVLGDKSTNHIKSLLEMSSVLFTESEGELTSDDFRAFKNKTVVFVKDTFSMASLLVPNIELRINNFMIIGDKITTFINETIPEAKIGIDKFISTTNTLSTNLRNLFSPQTIP
jgi:hypothetical protein